MSQIASASFIPLPRFFSFYCAWVWIQKSKNKRCANDRVPGLVKAVPAPHLDIGHKDTDDHSAPLHSVHGMYVDSYLFPLGGSRQKGVFYLVFFQTLSPPFRNRTWNRSAEGRMKQVKDKKLFFKAFSFLYFILFHSTQQQLRFDIRAQFHSHTI